MPRGLRRGSNRSPWLYKVTIFVLGSFALALLAISVVLSNAIQSASEGKQVQTSLRRPDEGDRSNQMDGIIQNHDAIQTLGPDAIPSYPRDERVQTPKPPKKSDTGANSPASEVKSAEKGSAPVKDSGRMLNSEIYQPDTTKGRRLVTYKRHGGRLVRYRSLLSAIPLFSFLDQLTHVTEQSTLPVCRGTPARQSAQTYFGCAGRKV